MADPADDEPIKQDDAGLDPADVAMPADDNAEAGSNGSAPTAKPGFRIPAPNKITVNNRFDIDTTRPLADFEHEFAEAFECTALDTGLSDHVAVVVNDRYPARQDIINGCLGAELPGVIFMRAASTVKWARDGTERFVIIYRRPGGNAVFSKHATRRDPLAEDVLRNGIIRPIFYSMRNFADRGMFHGNIRPDNIYMTTHDNAEALLGDCASAIPGIIQPPTYETIERAMTDRHGKGAGSVLDDIYAFGVTIAVLLRGSNPLEGKSAEAVIEEKIQRGSYAVFTDGLRLSPGVSELLRAILNDDPRQRWGLDQMSAWVDGTRTTPKQTSVGSRAQRAIDFNGKKYLRPRLLARDLTDNIHEAVTLIESGHVAKWVERALSDPDTAERINAAISRAAVGGRSQGYEERLVCFTSMALDPGAPVRFKGLRILPAGFGYSMAYAQINGQKLQTYGEFIRERYAWSWFAYKDNAQNPRQVEMQQHFDQAAKMIIRRGIDYGIERVFYELCPHAPCLSDMTRGRYVINCGLLLQALNDNASSFKDAKPVDRHVAAFISARDNRDNAGLMSILETGDPIRKSLALITLLQSMQKRYDNPKLPNLCEWLIKDAEVVAQRFKSQNLKQEIIRQIPKEAKTGSLVRIMALIDNPIQVKKDEFDFQQACRSYISMNQEKERVRNSINNDPSFGLASGRQIALVVSVILSGLVIASTIMLNFTGLGG